MAYRGTRQSTTSATLLSRSAAASLAILALGLSGCASSQDTDPAPTQSTPRSTVSTAPSPTPDTSGTPTASATSTIDPDREIALDQPLPDTDVDPRSTEVYDGPPRELAEIHHQECLEAFADGTEIPETEGQTDDDAAPWTAAESMPVPDRWKLCMTPAGSTLVIPAEFSVEAQELPGARIFVRVRDGAGHPLGGLRDVGAGSPPRGTELLRIVDIQTMPSLAAHDGETVYLRTLVVQARSGPQLMVDLVSAPFGVSPSTLEVWDLAVSTRGHRALVWASVPLASPEDADRVIGTRMHEVMEQMVGAYRPGPNVGR